ncbi:MAG: large-conductance mechanosensitive channel protein MscL [Pseudomonadota bacterium]
MRIVDEFKAFIARGNVVDLAVGVVIGAAFGKIVSSLVDGIVMPLLAMLTGGVKVDEWKLVMKPPQLDATGKVAAQEVALRYGSVLQTTIDFLLIAFVIFLFLRAYNRVRRPRDEAPPAPAEDVLLLREIRDLLASDHRPVP